MVALTLSITIVMTLVMLIAWMTQRALNNGGWTDVFWTYGTGVTCAGAALLAGGVPWRRILVAAMVAFWAFRLGTYVMLRVVKSREDVRYAAMRSDFGRSFQARMFGLLIVQGPVTGLLSIAILFAVRQPAPGLRWQDLAGLLIMALAIGGEGLADRQMKQFKAQSTDHGAVCDKGLWSFSRHPNYLFEWLGWFAYPVIGLTSQNGWSLLSLLAPLAMYALLRFVTGVPPLEAAMLKSKGVAYQRYQQKVGVLLPRLLP